MTAAQGVLGGVDRAAFAVALTAKLRAAGVRTGITATEDLVAAFAAAMPTRRSRLYWTARVCLVTRHEDIPAFDAVFAAAFDDAVLAMNPATRRRRHDAVPETDGLNVAVPAPTEDEEDGRGLPWATLPRISEVTDADPGELGVPERLPARLAALAEVPFEDLEPAELAALGRWIEQAATSWPTRRSRRFDVRRDGRRVALRATIARARRTGWEPVEVMRAAPRSRPRRVVMLCDVSQSMQAQAQAYLHLMRALVLDADAEVFAFATELTRLTTVLAHHSPGIAIEQANDRVGDRFGGTRIAHAIAELLSSHHANAVRGAVVLIGSDGWDADPPLQLGGQMARLARRAHRVVWMNPRAAAPGYEPRVGSMAAALPYCDRLLPADTFASLQAVLAEIGTPGRNRRAISSTG